MTLDEAIAYCELHECKKCILLNEKYHAEDCRTEYEKTVLHIPCCFNLLDSKNLEAERKKVE